jgi:hypothetical protein
METKFSKMVTATVQMIEKKLKSKRKKWKL